MKTASLILAMAAAFGTSTLVHAEGQDAATLKGIYDNGRNMLEGVFKEGKEEGAWQGFYRAGERRFRGGYLAGEPHGDWQSFYHFTVGGPIEDGRLTTLPAYANQISELAV